MSIHCFDKGLAFVFLSFVERWVLLFLVHLRWRVRVWYSCFCYHGHHAWTLCISDEPCDIVCDLLSLVTLFRRVLVHKAQRGFSLHIMLATSEVSTLYGEGLLTFCCFSWIGESWEPILILRVWLIIFLVCLPQLSFELGSVSALNP